MKHYILFLFCLIVPSLVQAQYSVSSPDMSVWVNLKTDKSRGFNSKILVPRRLEMSISVKGKSIIHNREIGLEVYSHGRKSSFGKADMVSCDYTTKTFSSMDEETFAKAGLRGKCYGMVLQSVSSIVLEVAVFNNGVAYRFSTNGFSDDFEYKILNVTDVFPDDRPNAILGTFRGDKVLPWRMMLFDDEEDHRMVMDDEWRTLYPSTKLVSWKDALSSISLGYAHSWFSGKRWGGLENCQSFYADFIYKHLYAGLSVTPCHELLYVFYEHDFDPFLGVMGSVKSWDVTCRLGYNFPLQNGYEVWSFSPYAAATYLNLHQHGRIHPTYHDVENKHHYLVGLGVKVQMMMRQRISLGVGYEYQLFTGSKEPKGRSTVTLSLGYRL